MARIKELFPMPLKPTTSSFLPGSNVKERSVISCRGELPVRKRVRMRRKQVRRTARSADAQALDGEASIFRSEFLIYFWRWLSFLHLSDLRKYYLRTACLTWFLPFLLQFEVGQDVPPARQRTRFLAGRWTHWQSSNHNQFHKFRVIALPTKDHSRHDWTRRTFGWLLQAELYQQNIVVRSRVQATPSHETLRSFSQELHFTWTRYLYHLVKKLRFRSKLRIPMRFATTLLNLFCASVRSLVSPLGKV